MTRVLNEKLMVFINNDGCFKRFFGIQKAKYFRLYLKLLFQIIYQSMVWVRARGYGRPHNVLGTTSYV